MIRLVLCTDDVTAGLLQSHARWFTTVDNFDVAAVTKCCNTSGVWAGSLWPRLCCTSSTTLVTSQGSIHYSTTDVQENSYFQLNLYVANCVIHSCPLMQGVYTISILSTEIHTCFIDQWGDQQWCVKTLRENVRYLLFYTSVGHNVGKDSSLSVISSNSTVGRAEQLPT